jgi:MFS family permease
MIRKRASEAWDTASKSALYGWLASEAVSLTGTRVSMLAIPWFVLTTTGSATRTGLAAFAEMAPYVAAKAVAGPLVDRVGPRRVSITCDSLSVFAVGSIPVLFAVHLLTFPILLGAVAVAGFLRGPGDGAKHALVPAIVARAQVPMERATGLGGAVERLASTLGAAFAGVLVAAVGGAPALIVDAASFAVSAVLIVGTAPRRRPAVAAAVSAGVDQAAEAAGTGRGFGGGTGRGYLAELREGWDFLRRDRVLVGIVTMVAITNLLDAAFSSVLVPVWAKHTEGTPTAVGWVFATFAATSILGALLAARYGQRLPRFLVYVVGFMVAGIPRFAVLALGVPLPWVLGVLAVGGLGSGFLNPILGAVIYERIPEPLMGRVTSLNTALCWAGIPFGGVLGGLLIAGIGLSPALLAVGAAYLVATMLPVLQPQWRQIDRRAPEGARIGPQPQQQGAAECGS